MGVAEEPGDGVTVFPAGRWEQVVGDVAPVGDVVFGVEVNQERTRAAIVASDRQPEPVVELVEYRAGTGWVPGWFRERGASAAVDPLGPSRSLIPDLEAVGVAVVKVKDMPGACANFYDRVVEGRIAVRRHNDLDSAVAAATKKESGDVWRWDRKSSADISPLGAATVAVWVASVPASGFGFVSLADL
jgi:hypothetical protein